MDLEVENEATRGIGDAVLDLAAARTRLLYQLPAGNSRGQALEITMSSKPVFRGPDWPGTYVSIDLSGTTRLGTILGPHLDSHPDAGISCVGDFAAGLPFANGSFDVVILHRTLDGLAALARHKGHDFVTGDFLSEVARVLTAGGLVIGCVENRHGLDFLLNSAKRFLGRTTGVADKHGSRRPLSVTSCRRELASAGFEQIRLFNLVPDADSPARLLSLDSGWSRRACRRQLEALRPLIGRSSYAVWRALAEIGVSQYLGPVTFFWGRRAC